MYKKKFELDYRHQARTLHPDDLGEHSSGWKIEGEVHEDWCEWVNEFEAVHPVYGRVWGDFEDTVYADSAKGYKHFVANHPFEEWDYYDI